MTDPDHSFTLTSVLRAPVPAVWARIASPEGINDELAPWLRMTFPAELARLGADEVPLGRRFFRSWILLGGVLPIDYDDLVLLSVEPGVGFHERSSMATARVWEHRRTLRAEGTDRCSLTDEVSFVPRVAALGPVLRAVSVRVFAHRHRRLRAHFGGGS